MNKPLPISYSNESAMATFTRAVIAAGLGALDKNTTSAEIARRWNDRSIDLVLRASVTPATLAGNPAIAQVAVAFLETLVPMSAGADLLNRGIGLNFAGAASIKVPGIAIPTADFV